LLVKSIWRSSLDHDHRRPLVEFVDDLLDFVEERGVALSTMLFDAGSATTTTSRSIVSKALVCPSSSIWRSW